MTKYYPTVYNSVYDIIAEDDNGTKFNMNIDGEPCYNPGELIEFVSQLYLQWCFNHDGEAVDLIQNILDIFNAGQDLCEYDTAKVIREATALEIFLSYTTGEDSGAFKHPDTGITCYTI